MYSDKINKISKDADKLLINYKRNQIENIISKLNSEKPSLEDIAVLLRIKDQELLSEVTKIANKKTLEFHGNKVGLIAPLYFSNSCINNCTICNFKKSDSIKRRTLNLEEYEKEVESILKLDYRTIEFVSGSFLWNTNISNRFLEIIERTKEKYDKDIIKNIAFSIDSLSEEQYGEFSDQNITLILWQETYDKNAYQYMIGKNSITKSDFSFRINSQERWIRSGGKRYGIGYLAGLSNNFKKEVLMTISHGKYLEEKYGIAPSVLGIPRIQESKTRETINMRKKVSDDDMLLMVALYRLCFPKSNIVASTRENQGMIKREIYAGASFTNHYCSTDVGGYSDPSSSKIQQFYHPDPTYKEMSNTIQSVEREIDINKVF